MGGSWTWTYAEFAKLKLRSKRRRVMAVYCSNVPSRDLVISFWWDPPNVIDMTKMPTNIC